MIYERRPSRGFIPDLSCFSLSTNLDGLPLPSVHVQNPSLRTFSSIHIWSVDPAEHDAPRALSCIGKEGRLESVGTK